MPKQRNWTKGRRGFQPRLDDSQRQALYECWLRNEWKNQPVKEMLKQSFGIELPDRTLGDYKKRLKQLLTRELKKEEERIERVLAVPGKKEIADTLTEGNDRDLLRLLIRLHIEKRGEYDNRINA